MRTLFIGVGSPIRGDDGVGPAVGERIHAADPAGNEFVPFEGSGLDLLGWLARKDAAERVVIVDSIDSGQVGVGEVARIRVQERAGTDTGTGTGFASSHHVGILEAFELAKKFGLAVPEVRLYAVGIRPAVGFREGLSPALAARLDDIVREIRDDVQAG
ncbi:MAG: hydrogenase maturation protease [Deltaproteobacteria bacterium]|nr:hydrogenase maturation protease [Deltaproteobacteria bacterium]